MSGPFRDGDRASAGAGGQAYIARAKLGGRVDEDPTRRAIEALVDATHDRREHVHPLLVDDVHRLDARAEHAAAGHHPVAATVDGFEDATRRAIVLAACIDDVGVLWRRGRVRERTRLAVVVDVIANVQRSQLDPWAGHPLWWQGRRWGWRWCLGGAHDAILPGG